MAETNELLAQAEKMGISLTGTETETEIRALVEAPKVEAPKTVPVVATSRGALPVSGIVEVGTQFEIEPAAFSAAWMRPANPAAAKAIKAAKYGAKV